MKTYAYATALGGLALATGLILYHGVALVLQALQAAGYGLIGIILFHLIPLAWDTLAWRALLPEPAKCPFSHFMRARWIKESVNNLLPVAQLGGRLVAVRLLIREGIAAEIAGASIVVDLTLAVLTQLGFTLFGVGLLVSLTQEKGIALSVLGGVAIMSALVAGFLFLQRRGLFEGLMTRLSPFITEERWLELVGGSKRLDAAIEELYAKRAALATCAGVQLFSWVAGAGEVWLTLYFIGQPVTMLEAIVIESLGRAVRSAAFGVPAGLGVQEGGYILICGAFALSPQTGLSVSLAKRVRELVVGVPGLAVWQAMEGISLAAAGRHGNSKKLTR
ncbi:MAG: lysylphosphatidylglycerol synthase domain-containing protein [Gammaproteobacteria bacterium]